MPVFATLSPQHWHGGDMEYAEEWDEQDDALSELIEFL